VHLDADWKHLLLTAFIKGVNENRVVFEAYSKVDILSLVVILQANGVVWFELRGEFCESFFGEDVAATCDVTLGEIVVLYCES
jgi:hypothetical protein